MRIDRPRVSPLADGEGTPAQRELLEKAALDGQVLNIFRTMAHHPDLFRRWLVFAGHVLSKSTLPARQRELVILRVGWLCRSGYEWGQHVVIGKKAGLEEGELARIAHGPEASGWNREDRALLRATDELHRDAHISDSVWDELDFLDVQQKMDLVFAVGQYNLVSMALNTLGVQLDEGVPTWQDCPGFEPS